MEDQTIQNNFKEEAEERFQKNVTSGESKNSIIIDLSPPKREYD